VVVVTMITMLMMVTVTQREEGFLILRYYPWPCYYYRRPS
jgi:hypothetical protein